MAESRKRYRKCEPSDEFESMMRWYQSCPGIECAFVPCYLLTPDYSLLEKDQLEYYFWWRRNLSEGRLLESDKGYVWLRICEIANIVPPEQGLREVSLLRGCSAALDLPPEQLDRVAADICIANGMPIPLLDHGKDEVARGMMVSEAMWDPSRIEGNGLSALIGKDRAETLSRIPNGIDGFVRLLESLGTDEYLLGTETALRSLFPKHVRFDSSKYIVTYDVYSDDLNRLFDDIFIHITGQGAPSRSFRKRVEDPSEKHASVKRTERGSSRVPVSKREVDLMEMGEDLFGEETPIGRKGTGSVTVQGPDGPLGSYMRSDSGCPDYRKLSDKQRAFFSEWSSEADSGKHHDADTGYVWMRLCGLINSTESPATVLKHLMAMDRAYSGSIASALIRRTCMDFILKNGLRIPDSSFADGNDEAGMLMGRPGASCGSPRR